MKAGSTPAFVLRLVPFGISFVGTFFATLLQLKPDALAVPLWTPWALAAVIAAGPAFGIVLETLHRQDSHAGDRVAASVIALHASLCGVGPFDNENIGYTVFRTRRTPLHLKRGQQIRVYRLRLSDKPKASAVRWTWRKGLLGACWHEKRERCMDTQKHFNGVKAETRREWRRVPRHVRQRMSVEEYKSVRDYKHVVAFPLITSVDGRYVGCLAIQVGTKACRQELHDHTGETSTECSKVVDRSLVSIADLLG